MNFIDGKLSSDCKTNGDKTIETCIPVVALGKFDFNVRHSGIHLVCLPLVMVKQSSQLLKFKGIILKEIMMHLIQ